MTSLQKVHELIAFDSKVTFPIIEEGFGLCKNAIYEAPPKNLKKLKNWAWLLPHPLIDQQERAHVEHEETKTSWISW